MKKQGYWSAPSQTKTVRSWPKESVAYRIERSLSMLYLHGYVTEGERAKIRRRVGPPPWTANETDDQKSVEEKR